MRSRDAILPSIVIVALVSFCACRSSKDAPENVVVTSDLYEKHVLDTAYRAEGVAVFDVNRDGVEDIVTDQFWYAGPDFTPHEIRTPETYDPATQFCHGFAVMPWDVDGDGFLDIVVAPHVIGDPMLWYRNPKGADAHWTSYVLAPMGAAGLETPIAVDLFGDGRKILLSGDAQSETLGWQVPGADVTQPWPLHAVSAPRFPGAGMAVHGIGAGDVDGDGRLDVLTGYGYFTGTEASTVWTFHPFSFGPDACSRMFAFDVNGDGRSDVLCAHPHDYGLHAWLQNARDASADATFTDVLVDGTISQMHALRLDDLDGDGTPEIVSGKRFWAHGASADPGVGDPAVLSFWTIHAGEGGAQPSFERTNIDADSGVGTQFEIADVDGDGKRDVVVSNKKGLFFFRRR
jgi:hypothetical protein